jgi:hypothetical protein
MKPPDLLRDILARPERAPTLALADWDLVVRQARRSGLLARLLVLFRDKGVIDCVPRQPRRHLDAERILGDKFVRDVQAEVRYILATLRDTGVPIVLLKGAAYVVAKLPPSRGRKFGDVDVMVPLDRLDEIEAVLVKNGWSFGKVDPYDERYYRVWMHQIPPMEHFERHTTIDVHHTIVARTTRLRLDPRQLFDAAVPVDGNPMLKVLAPTDMLLHCATHLLNQGQFERGVRDLDDFKQLLHHFAVAPDFWNKLVERAVALNLERPLYYALRYTHRLLGAEVPESIRNDARLDPPNPVLRAVMDLLFERALRSNHRSCQDGLSRVARGILYMRAHFLLMPVPILVPHLVRKAFMRASTQEPV